MLTTIILTRNNCIAKTLASILPLNSKVIIGNIGKEIVPNAINIPFHNDYGEAKNKLLSNIKGWVFYIEPNEILLTGVEEILEAMKIPSSYAFNVLGDGVLTKQTRLWHTDLKLKFFNPIFEAVEDNKSKVLNTIIRSETVAYPDEEQILESWRKSKPASSSPYYYTAFSLLAKRKYQQFLVAANHYLFMEPKGIPAVMMQYYMATILLYINQDSKAAIEKILSCIIAKPTMAEFWCLLADAYYNLKRYAKAKTLYENAILLGSRRLKTDLWTMEVSKYLDHPSKMIKSCSQMLNNT